MSKKWNMIVDIDECVGCYNCFLACKDEYVGNEQKGYFSSHPEQGKAALNLKYEERGTYPNAESYYIPVMCNHCDDAPCMKADKDGAISKRKDGIVIIDPVKAKGKKYLVGSCPYGAIIWNEETDTPQTWIFDAHLLDRGYTQPRCIDVCPTDALKSFKITDEEMNQMAKDENLVTLLPEAKTKSRVYYKNYHKITSCFVAGNTFHQEDGVTDCLEGVSARLFQGKNLIAEATSDAFGDFKISNLQPGSGECQLMLEYNGYQSVSLNIEITNKPLDVGSHIIHKVRKTEEHI